MQDRNFRILVNGPALIVVTKDFSELCLHDNDNGKRERSGVIFVVREAREDDARCPTSNDSMRVDGLLRWA